MAAIHLGREGSLAAAHFNHRLRGQESVADEEFVRQLCREMEIPFQLGAGDVSQFAHLEGDGLEAAART